MVTPVGDPGAMRAKARALGAYADRIRHVSAQLGSRASSIEYRGPAADRFRTAIHDQRVAAERIAGELYELKQYLLRSAAELEYELRRRRMLA